MLNDKLKNMKLLMLKTFMLSCLITGSMFAQDFSGRATYRTHQKSLNKSFLLLILSLFMIEKKLDLETLV